MTPLDSSTRREPIPVGTLLLLAGATIGWGVGATLTRYAVSEVAPFAVTLFRFGVGAVLLLVLLSRRGAALTWPPRRDWPMLLLLGLLGVTMFGSLYGLALQWTSAAEGTLIHGIVPMVTLGLAALLLREPVSRAQIVAGVVSFTGLAVLLLGSTAEWSGANRVLGDVLMLGAVLSWSGYSVAVRKSVKRFSLDEMSAYSVLIGAVLLVPLALAEPVRRPFSDVNPLVWLALAYLALVSCCLSYLWWNEGVRTIGAGRAASFTFLVPVAAMLSAIPVLGEWPELVQLVGGALIVSGLFIANRSSRGSGGTGAAATRVLEPEPARLGRGGACFGQAGSGRKEMRMQDYNGRVVVITGAATGIGFALARQFVGDGARVVIAARRRDRLGEAAAALSASGGDVRLFECDVTQREQVEALADFAVSAFGRVDVIVNNAGVGPIPSTVIDATREDVQRVLDVNLFGVWNGVSVFGKRFIAQGTPAAIYNVGSENCFFNAVPLGAGYVASKHAVLAMTIALREEVPDHIEVGLICPGLVRSELARETSEGMDTDRYAALVMAQLRAGEPIIVSHAHNIVRIRDRHDEIERAYATYAPRYEGDDEFDVRTLGVRHNWYPDLPRMTHTRPS